MTVGYSGTPLWKKLGLKPGHNVFVANPPENYRALIEPLRSQVAFVPLVTGDVDLFHVFSKESQDLQQHLAAIRANMRHDSVIWVSWPKKASKVPTDITEDTIRTLAFPLDLVDIKVCAVDATWSGLKLMIRRENRQK
ncbi:MAG: DUF3052 family protein [Acidobacteria bacterium]|nr:DUF3052 family protein [Acidobacteriota bacterium]